MKEHGEDAAHRASGLNRREALGLLAAGTTVAASASSPALATAVATETVPNANRFSLLYPHESATRKTHGIQGLWRFKLDPQNRGEQERWFDGVDSARRIPVPCSWNDLFDDAKDYFGAAWYETDIWVDAVPADSHVHLRFGSVIYHARVWLDGVLLGEHAGGYLPFGFDVTSLVRPGRANRLVVRVENELRLDRVPAIPDPAIEGMSQRDYPQTAYDFFPYAGINRPVSLCIVPATRIHDITVVTALAGQDGIVTVDVEVTGKWSGPVEMTIEGGGKAIRAVAAIRDGIGKVMLRVPRAKLWSPDNPFLYRLITSIGGDRLLDSYAMNIGIRTITVDGSRLLLNNEPVFLRGFGKHEDFAISGRSLDLPVLVRDFELLKWIGANSFRTSHYPYSEEALMLADEYGFLVIDETPAVGMVFVDAPEIIDARYTALEASLDALVKRDKNHPCVIMWSLANEPLAKPFRVNRPVAPETMEAGRAFFEKLFSRARALDPTRPRTIVTAGNGPAEWARYGDIICTNSYNGWYSDGGQLADGRERLEKDLATLRAAHGDKPIFVTEFGADAVAGLHTQPAEMWSEEYQADMVEGYIAVLDKHPYVIGTHPWAFADFKTSQSTGRIGGLNLKGVFTRDRRPKLAATLLHRLWKKTESKVR